MPLQNRVDPFGEIFAVPERGLFMGNRGIIHDPENRTLLKKRWTLPAWIICVCEFKNVRRDPMGRNGPGNKAGWTELFFLDEVTALAAGHRPCFYCRRDRARDFLARFGEAFGIAEPRAPMLDKRLHLERLASGGKPPSISAHDLATLPDGAMFGDGGTAYALRAGTALRWTFAAYREHVDPAIFDDRSLRLLTPATTISILKAGYRPAWAGN